MDYSNQPTHSTESRALIAHPSASVSLGEPYYGVTSRNGVETIDSTESSRGFLEYWHLLRRHKTTILLATLAGLLLGFAVGIPMKPVYRAHTSLEVLNINEDFMNMRQASQTTTNNDSYDTSEEQTQARLLQSDALIKRVLTKLDPSIALKERRAQIATSGWRSWLHLPPPANGSELEQLLSKAAESLKVRSEPRTRVLQVTVDSRNANLAADFANILVQQFIAQNLEERYNSTRRTSEWLNREIDDARLRLRTSENALQTYAGQSGLIFTDDNTNVATEKLQQLQQELSTATADRITRQSRYELAKNSPPDALADVLNDPGLRATAAKINDVRSQVADLSAIYNPAYSKSKRTQAELEALQAGFDRDRADIIRRIENDYHEATRKESLLLASYDAQIKEVTKQGEKAIQYNILKRETDSNRQLYDTMLQQTKQASIASAMHASNVRVVDPAEVPSLPISPNFKINSIVGLFAGLLLSVAFVSVRDHADRTLHQPGDIKLWTDLPELGTIPSAAASMKTVYGRPTRSELTHSSVTGDLVPNVRNRSKTDSVELITWLHKPSALAEAFRSSLTSILFVGQNGNQPRTLVFTSASPSDGKTTVVSNIAIANAEIRRKVLVIDADLRRPRMHDVFNLSNERGLTDLLSEEFSENNILGLVQTTDVPGLSVLTGGPPAQAAAHLLYSPNLALMLNKFKKEYDMIIIDTPPMLQLTDARVVGRLADGVVLVARAGQTTRDALLAVKERFEEDRIRILGAVLNDWDPKRSHNAYPYNSGYQSRYGTYVAQTS
jgi:succinoglycan biosynthesis transport protein ExoP